MRKIILGYAKWGRVDGPGSERAYALRRLLCMAISSGRGLLLLRRIASSFPLETPQFRFHALHARLQVE